MDCPSCGTAVPPGGRFCPSCGTEVGARTSDERRVATVLFGDLVGFTSLSETRDPEQVKTLVDRCFQRLARDIEEFGGRVDKIIGDAIVALFGAPVAHEDDAERAVRAALRMQKTMEAYAAEIGAGGSGPEIHMRIGVNTGEVLTGAMVAGGDYTAMGDVVNTASRLQAGAASGTVVVGPSTHAATVGAIEYQSLGLFEAKGRGEPVEAYQARRSLRLPGRRPRRRRTPLIGRSAELELLQASVRLAYLRRRGDMILLYGEAGVGKTRLADELKEWAADDHAALVLEGRCVPYGEANLWFPLALAVRQLCGVPIDTPVDQAFEIVRSAVAREMELDERSAAVKRLCDGLVYLLGATDLLADLDAQAARDEAARSLSTVIERVAQHRPVFLRIADLHWADDLVLELLETVFDELGRSPFILIATAREAFEDRWTPSSSHHHRLILHIDPLDAQASAELLDSLSEHGLIDGIDRDDLLARSGGNPLFLEELLKLVVPVEDRLETESSEGPVELPETLRGLVAARLDRLLPAERAVIDNASVFGRSGPVLALERMADVDDRVESDDVVEIVDELSDADLLEVEGRLWAFRSDVVREVAYGTLTKADRARRHAGIASYVEDNLAGGNEEVFADTIAHHYSLAARLAGEIDFVAGLPDDLTERAIHWLELAADQAGRAEIHLLAARLFHEAIELVGDEPSSRRLSFHLGRAGARVGLFELDEARDDVDVALADASALGDRLGRANARLLLGEIEQQSGNLDESATILNDVFAEFESIGDRRGAAESLRRLGMVSLFRGAYREAEETTSVALKRFLQLADRRGEAWALQNLAWIAYMSGRVSEAEDRLGESTEVFSEVGDQEGLGWSNGLLAFTRLQQGDFAEAERVAESILPDAQQRGDRFGEGMMLFLIALVRLWTGRTDEARTMAEQALNQARRSGDPLAQRQAENVLGRALVHAGHIDEGFRVLESTFSRDTRSRGMSGQEIGAQVMAGAALWVGDVARAGSQLGLLELDSEPDSALGSSERRAVGALVLLQIGRPDDAVALLEGLAESDSPDPNVSSAWALVLAVADRPSEAVRAADRCLVDGRATYLDRTIAHLATGLAQAAIGDLSGVLASFSEVRAIVDSTGDRLSQAVVRLVEARCLAAVRSSAARDVEREADRALEAIGMTAAGWRTICDLALDRVRAS